MTTSNILWYVAGSIALLICLALVVPTSKLISYENSIALPLILCMAVFTAPSLAQSTAALWRATRARTPAPRKDLMVVGYHFVFAAAILGIVANVVRIGLGGAPSPVNAHILVWSKFTLILGAVLLFWSGSIDPEGRTHNKRIFAFVVAFGVLLGVGVQVLQQYGFVGWATGQIDLVPPAIAASLDSVLQ